MRSLDNCPTCGRRITDFDMTGCETDSGQRWCLVHLPHSRLRCALCGRADLHVHEGELTTRAEEEEASRLRHPCNGVVEEVNDGQEGSP